MKTHIDSLTGLRFFAAAAIVLQHLAERSNAVDGLLEGSVPAQGVSVFFVLSGFILTHVYPTLDSREQILRFFRARFARVWPVHFLVLILVASVYRGNPAAPPEASGDVLPLLMNATLTQAFVPYPSFFFSFNAVSWSVSTEFGFYLLFPLLIRNLASTWLWKLLAALFLSVFMVFCAAHFDLAASQNRSAALAFEGLTYVNPLARSFEFVLGMCAALGWQQYGRVTAQRLPGGGIFWTGLEIAAAALLLFNISLMTPVLWPLISAWGMPANHWMRLCLSPALPAAMLIIVLAMSKGGVSRLLAWRPIRFLGEISFSIYLIHQLLLIAFARLSPDMNAGFIVAYLATLLGVSAALWHFIEMPARRFIVGRPARNSIAP